MSTFAVFQGHMNRMIETATKTIVFAAVWFF